MKKFDLYMNYNLKNEDSEGLTEIRTNTSISKTIPNISMEDVKKEVVNFVNSIPETSSGLEIWVNHVVDIVDAVQKL